MKKFVIIEKEYDVYSFNLKKRSPVLKIENDVLFFNNKTYNLNGLSIEKWLNENSNLLTHNVSNSGKEGSSEVYTYNENFILQEVKLDDDEDYFINYKIDEQTFKKDILQLNNLLLELEKLFHIVEPNINNNKTYGLAFRDLIIKSCTEVETHWKELISQLPPDLPIIIIGGTGEEAFFKSIGPYPDQIINLVGKTSISEMIAIISQAKALVVTDTGMPTIRHGSHHYRFHDP